MLCMKMLNNIIIIIFIIIIIVIAAILLTRDFIQILAFSHP